MGWNYYKVDEAKFETDQGIIIRHLKNGFDGDGYY